MGTVRVMKIRQWLGYDPHEGERKYLRNNKTGQVICDDPDRRRYRRAKKLKA